MIGYINRSEIEGALLVDGIRGVCEAPWAEFIHFKRLLSDIYKGTTTSTYGYAEIIVSLLQTLLICFADSPIIASCIKDNYPFKV